MLAPHWYEPHALPPGKPQRRRCKPQVPGDFLQTEHRGKTPKKHGSLNVPIEHHPTIRYMVYNGYYKVMSNIPKMGHLPTPEKSPWISMIFQWQIWSWSPKIGDHQSKCGLIVDTVSINIYTHDFFWLKNLTPITVGFSFESARLTKNWIINVSRYLLSSYYAWINMNKTYMTNHSARIIQIIQMQQRYAKHERKPLCKLDYCIVIA